MKSPTWMSLRGLADQRFLAVSYWVIFVVPILCGLSLSLRSTKGVLSPAAEIIANSIVDWRTVVVFFSCLSLASANAIFRWKCPPALQGVSGLSVFPEFERKGLGPEIDWRMSLASKIDTSSSQTNNTNQGILMDALQFNSDNVHSSETAASITKTAWVQLNHREPIWRGTTAVLLGLGASGLGVAMAERIWTVFRTM